MEETKAIIGILLISAIAIASYFVIEHGASGAVPTQTYLNCCCDILAKQGYAKQAQYTLVRSHLETFAASCDEACDTQYAGQGSIFSEEGLCASE